jgi:hypothetical protein
MSLERRRRRAAIDRTGAAVEGPGSWWLVVSRTFMPIVQKSPISTRPLWST